MRNTTLQDIFKKIITFLQTNLITRLFFCHNFSAQSFKEVGNNVGTFFIQEDYTFMDSNKINWPYKPEKLPSSSCRQGHTLAPAGIPPDLCQLKTWSVQKTKQRGQIENLSCSAAVCQRCYFRTVWREPGNALAKNDYAEIACHGLSVFKQSDLWKRVLLLYTKHVAMWVCTYKGS